MTRKCPDYTETLNYYIKGYSIHIPTPQNIKFLNAKIDLIDHCLIELSKNERKTKMPENNFLKEASYSIQ